MSEAPASLMAQAFALHRVIVTPNPDGSLLFTIRQHRDRHGLEPEGFRCTLPEPEVRKLAEFLAARSLQWQPAPTLDGLQAARGQGQDPMPPSGPRLCPACNVAPLARNESDTGYVCRYCFTDFLDPLPAPDQARALAQLVEPSPGRAATSNRRPRPPPRHPDP